MIPAALEHNKFIYNICSPSAELSIKSLMLMAFFFRQNKQTNKPTSLEANCQEAMKEGKWMNRRETQSSPGCYSIRHEVPGLEFGSRGMTFYISQTLSSWLREGPLVQP